MTGRRFAMVTALALVVSSAAHADARPRKAKQKQKQARALLRAGDDQASAKHHKRALELYRRSLAASPTPIARLKVAKMEIALGRPIAAVKLLEAILEDGGARIKVQQEAERILGETLTRVGSLDIDIDVDGSQITIDGEDVGTSPIADVVYLEPGTHRYSVSKEGFKEASGTVTVAAGSQETLLVEFTREGEDEGEDEGKPAPETPNTSASAPEPAIGADATARAASAPSRSRTPLDVSFGLAGGMLLLAVYPTLQYRLLDEHLRFGTLTDEERTQAERDWRTNRILARGLVGAAAFGAVVGTVYYYGYYDRERPKSLVRIEPQVSSGMVGLQVGGDF